MKKQNKIIDSIKLDKPKNRKYFAIFLTIFLGISITIAIRQNNEPEVLSSAREDELVLILDDLVNQTDQLERELNKQQQILDSLKNISISKNLVLSGGCAYNGTANGKIVNKTIFDHLWIPPAPSDAGSAIGAVIHYLVKEKKFRDKITKNPFLEMVGFGSLPHNRFCSASRKRS